MDRRSERGQATRQQLVGVATQLFAEHGYEAVSLDAVLAACAISKGALYHHFAGKKALFMAVLESAEADIAGIVARAAGGAADPLAALRAGSRAWIDLAATDAVVRRVVLTDAPAVIGWEAWRELDARYGLGLLKSAMSALLPEAHDQPERVTAAAHALLAVLTEMALLIARTPDPAMTTAAFAVVEGTLQQFARPPA